MNLCMYLICLLLLTGMPQHCMDLGMRGTASQGQNRQLHSHPLKPRGRGWGRGRWRNFDSSIREYMITLLVLDFHSFSRFPFRDMFSKRQILEIKRKKSWNEFAVNQPSSGSASFSSPKLEFGLGHISRSQLKCEYIIGAITFSLIFVYVIIVEFVPFQNNSRNLFSNLLFCQILFITKLIIS